MPVIRFFGCAELVGHLISNPFQCQVKRGKRVYDKFILSANLSVFCDSTVVYRINGLNIYIYIDMHIIE